MSLYPHPNATVALIGAPTDVGAAHIGARLGPGALRVAGLGPALARMGLQVADLGDLPGPDNPERAPEGGLRHLPEVIAWNRLVHDACLGALQAQRLPILMGGDHALAIGSIAAASRHARQAGLRLKVIWLDAHADFNTAALTPSGNLHGMPVACLCGHGPNALTQLAGPEPALNPRDIVQLGIRSVDEGEKRLVHEMGISVFDMRSIDELGMREAMRQALADVDEQTHLHVSLDVDFLDPDIAPGVGTTVRGGPTYREAQLCMEMLADTGRLCSMDIVELNPALDVRNQTALLAVDLVESLMGKTTLMRAR
ncbi:MAG: arginase [Pseudomonadota bacterium]|jgi:arginase